MEPGAYIAVHARGYKNPDGSLTSRQLEMNWYGSPLGWDQDGVTAALYNVQTTGEIANAVPVVRVDVLDHPEGFYLTDIVLANLTSSELG